MFLYLPLGMKYKHYLFVDVETSGIPQHLSSSVRETDKWPFLIQVAWVVCKADGTVLKEENHFIFEPEIQIRKSSEKVHGISISYLKEHGKERRAVLQILQTDLRHYQPLVVGHFVELDSKMLQVGMQRAGLKNILPRYPHFCTMIATSEYSRIPHHHYPNLGDLYEGLFGKKLTRLHDAIHDARATSQCFFELLRRGDIVLNETTTRPNFLKGNKPKPSKAGCGLVMLSFIIATFVWIWM